MLMPILAEIALLGSPRAIRSKISYSRSVRTGNGALGIGSSGRSDHPRGNTPVEDRLTLVHRDDRADYGVPLGVLKQITTGAGVQHFLDPS
jgi:hypothetical protein